MFSKELASGGRNHLGKGSGHLFQELPPNGSRHTEPSDGVCLLFSLFVHVIFQPDGST